MIDIFNATIYLVLALGAAWAVMSPRFLDGIVVKFGLILISLGCFAEFLILATSTTSAHQDGADAVVNFGVLVCIVGYHLRARRCGGPLKRRSDWVERRGAP